MTDSNSGITQQMGKEMGVTVLPMPFFINGKQYFEDIDLTQEQFYEHLTGDSEISTSQPSPADVIAAWEKLLKDYDEVVYMPMSSGLSSSCSSAMGFAEDYDGRVQVVNNQRISVTLKQAVRDAQYLVSQGRSAAEIKEILERDRFQSSIYITLDTLRYLKKGGRITPAAAAVGTVLSIKPVLQIQGEKLDAFSKARGFKQAKRTMLNAIEKDLKERFAGKPMQLAVSYTPAEGDSMEPVNEWIEEVKERFPDYTVDSDPLSLSVSCHIGPGALAIAVAVTEDASQGVIYKG